MRSTTTSAEVSFPYLHTAANHLTIRFLTVFFNKSNKSAALISKPYRKTLNRSLFERIRSALIQVQIPETGDREIDLCPWPESVTSNGTLVLRKSNRPEYIRLKDEQIKVDMIVYCTGYRQEFPFIAKQNESGKGKPYPTADMVDVRNIWHSDDPTYAYIGFLRPNLGAIPPLAEMQAQLWVCHLLAPHKIPKALHPRDESHYRLWHLNESRIHYGVDHESYVYQLALDMDAALGALEAVRMGFGPGENAWRIPLVWAFGSGLNTKFRLRGPWKWSGAENVLKGEMWEQIKKRRWLFREYFLFF